MTDTPTVTPEQRFGDGLRVALGVGGLVAAILGVLIMISPVKSGVVAMQIIAVVMAAYTLVTGVVYIGTAIFSRSLGGWARTGHVLLGLLYIVGGVIMAANLGATATVLAVFLAVTIGVLWIFEGIMAFTVLKLSSNKAWTVIHAVISLIAGVVLILSPLLGAVTLWLLLGVSMLVLGIAQIVRAFSLGKSA